MRIDEDEGAGMEKMTREQAGDGEGKSLDRGEGKSLDRGEGKSLDRAAAWALLTEYNQDTFHLNHARTMESVMGYFARRLGYGEEAEFWSLVGLLHDLDFELYPEQHCVKSQEIMRERGLSPRLIRATASHGYGITVDIQPEHEMEKVLYATDELTGLIGAVAIMRPSKSTLDLELKSVKKKYKTASFAAGCSREVIERGAAMLGWEVDDLIQQTILALREYEIAAGAEGRG
ncbi:MAG: hydrolase [Peptococcaceae bacterium]|jgi:predicted hydrolase (HD superfamily)|nr:hydrolase [Peptococcaceae bacterium]